MGGRIEGSSNATHEPPVIANTILWDNHEFGPAADNLALIPKMTTPIALNCVFGYDDPGFRDAPSGDFGLACGSPLIDAGTDAVASLPLTDYEGDPRLIGAAVDIGIDEYLNPPNYQKYCVAAVNSSGQAASIDVVGCDSIATNEIALTVDGLPNTPGLFFYGPSQLQVPFGDGFRCVGGAVRRLPPMGAMGSAISVHINLANMQVAPGAVSNFQYWFRDMAAGGSGFSLSDGVSVTFVQ